jgi:hypothetical protein
MRFFGMELFQSGGTYSALPSVPRSEIILFEKDTVVLGYSLLTNATDGVIYYTSGSGAGGDAGGAAKPSGTWTISGLSGGAVTLTSAQCGTPSFTIAVIPTVVLFGGGGKYRLYNNSDLTLYSSGTLKVNSITPNFSGKCLTRDDGNVVWVPEMQGPNYPEWYLVELSTEYKY